MTKRLFTGLIASSLFLTLLVGCGGNGVTSSIDNGGRGEGNIPIGRIKNPPSASVSVTAFNSDGTTTLGTITPEGTIYMQPLPYGSTSLAVQPTSSSLANTSYTIEMSAQQRYVINVELEPKSTEAVVTDITIETPNADQLEVGKTYPLIVKPVGDKLQGLKPSVWVEGGVAYLDSGNRMITVGSGQVVVHAKLLGVERSVTFTIN